MKSSEWLKKRTQAKHHQIDRHAVVSRLVAKDMSEAEYGSILASLHAWLHTLSHYLTPLRLAAPYLLEDKLVQLEKDMTTLGLKVSSPNQLDTPQETYAFCLGVHYVIEGSTLGAQFIAPRIEETLKRDDVTHFYRGYGEKVMPHWFVTQQRLDNELCTDMDREHARKGAVFAFDALIEFVDHQVNSLTTLKEMGGV